ncbi:MAG: hypothetical protein IKO11_06795 [Lachnospiraceae bacterium]|nr:hypothetical protein [Lachnospiraceae bacterium]
MKAGRKGIYNLINILVLGVSAGWFIAGYVLPAELPALAEPIRIPVVVLTVVLVHMVKAGRLYLALYGLDMKHGACMKLYCKVTPVSVVLPWKLGEFFRIYCCGAELGSFLKGGVIILLDRFFDTMALVTMIVLLWLFSGGWIPPLAYVLLAFLGLVFFLYLAFPGMHEVWKKNLLSAKATPHRLSMLKLLDTLGRVHGEIRTVLGGRGILLYLLSMAAWGVEIGSLAFLQGPEESIGARVARYLYAAVGMEDSVELKRFVVFTIVLLIFAYGIIKLAELIAASRREAKKGKA